MEFRIEINVARKGARTPVWHYLMEDEFTPVSFDTEEDAVAVCKDMTGVCRVVQVD